QGVQKALGDLAHEMLLGEEVVEEGFLRDIDGVADLVHLDGRYASRREPLHRDADDAVVHLAYPTFAPRRGFGSGCRVRHVALTAYLTNTVNCINRDLSVAPYRWRSGMKFGLLYEIEVPRPWTETSVADCYWKALEQMKLAKKVGFTH